jgi:flagellar FliL protein
MAAKNAPKEALPQSEIQAEQPKKKSRVKRLVIILVILLMMLGGGGGAGYWWLYMRKPVSDAPVQTAEGQATQGAEADKAGQGAVQGVGSGSVASGGGTSAHGSGGAARIERPNDLPRSSGQVLSLPPITVNLSDAGGRRYLKLGMEVEVNADVSAQIKAQSARIRDAIIMLLAGKTYNDIATPDGKVLLKAEIAARLNQVFGAQRVIQVYFTNFVVE